MKNITMWGESAPGLDVTNFDPCLETCVEICHESNPGAYSVQPHLFVFVLFLAYTFEENVIQLLLFSIKKALTAAVFTESRI